MKKLVKNNVSWVGKVDWELLKFHGDDYSTHKGSTYNSYLIEEEKTVLIDTVWMPFADEFVENLKKEIDLNKIDFEGNEIRSISMDQPAPFTDVTDRFRRP